MFENLAPTAAYRSNHAPKYPIRLSALTQLAKRSGGNAGTSKSCRPIQTTERTKLGRRKPGKSATRIIGAGIAMKTLTMPSATGQCSGRHLHPHQPWKAFIASDQ